MRNSFSGHAGIHSGQEKPKLEENSVKRADGSIGAGPQEKNIFLRWNLFFMLKYFFFDMILNV